MKVSKLYKAYISRSWLISFTVAGVIIVLLFLFGPRGIGPVAESRKAEYTLVPSPTMTFEFVKGPMYRITIEVGGTVDRVIQPAYLPSVSNGRVSWMNEDGKVEVVYWEPGLNPIVSVVTVK